MKNLDTFIFNWMAGGYMPNPTLLLLAKSLAMYGSWLAAVAWVWTLFKSPAQRVYPMVALAVAAFSGMLAHGIAANWTSPRPFVLGLSPSYIPHGSSGSLPSTHATVLFTLAFIMALRPVLRRAAMVMALIALATGWARIYCGVHFPFDILAGAVLAGLVTLAFYSCSRTAATVVGSRIAGINRRG